MFGILLSCVICGGTYLTILYMYDFSLIALEAQTEQIGGE